MFYTPQLKRLASGKVRDSYRVDDERRLLVVSDRISAFNSVLETKIPGKGSLVNGLSNAWFEKTRHIVENHFIEAIDPNVSLVREATPIPLRVVVRGYLTGSIWRRYVRGERTFSGVKLPNGMEQYELFPHPIVTPTTTDGTTVHSIAPDEIVENGIVDQETYDHMHRFALELFDFGSKLCAKRSITLIDSSYTFGFVDGSLTLIGELHTPDSSRFRMRGAHEWIDKEYVRQWLLKNSPRPRTLPEEVVKETLQRYRQVYELLLKQRWQPPMGSVRGRMYRNFVRAGLIREGFISIVMASEADRDHALAIRSHLAGYDVHVEMRVASAYRNGEDVAVMAQAYNQSVEPAAVIAIGGDRNGLGGALAANLSIPVINSPLSVGWSDQHLFSHSSSATVADPLDAAACALRCLNLHNLRERFEGEIVSGKEDLRCADARMQAECQIA